MSGIKAIVFDLDGTLTQHRSPLGEKNRRLLDRLREKYRLVMAGAGTCERIWNQLDRYPIEIIGCYGMQYAVCEDGALRLRYEERVPVDREKQLARARLLRERFGLKDYVGEPLEFHPTGAMTFPVLGTDAPIAQKLAYDPDGEKRRVMLPFVRELFSEYRVMLGGSNSFDIIPRQYGKLNAVRRFLRENGLSEQEIVFCGDDYAEGGNDHDLFASGIPFVQVDDYERLEELLAQKGLL